MELMNYGPMVLYIVPRYIISIWRKKTRKRFSYFFVPFNRGDFGKKI